MAVTAALVFAVAAGGTMAAQRVTSKELSLDLKAASLSVVWDGTGTGESDRVDIPLEDIKLLPAQEYKFSDENNYQVTNPGNDGDMEAYVRVTVTKYWVDENGNKIPDTNADLIKLTCNSDDWTTVQVDDNPFEGRTKNERQVFYYKKPLEQGAHTSDLLQSLKLSAQADNDYSGKRIYLEAKAEAVQYVPNEEELNERAILSAWGVKADVDNESGAITSITN